MTVGGLEQNVGKDRDRIFPFDDALHERKLVQEIASLERQFHGESHLSEREKVYHIQLS
jgi:hypothetical protein